MIIFWLTLYSSLSAQAAPCCSGASSIPTVITGDEQTQLKTSISQSKVIGDAPEKGVPVFRSNRDREISRTIKIEGASLISDSWQVGAAFPWIWREHQLGDSSQSGSSMGDLKLNAAYEFLPELTYSPWKPKGFLFASMTLPTGPSIYDSKEPGAIDATGKGFYTAGVGALLVKRWSSWDAFVVPEFHRSFGRSFETVRFESFWGASLGVGGGVSPGAGDLRLGASLQPQWEQGKESVSLEAGLANERNRASHQFVWNFSVDVSYVITDEWTAQASYADQTIFGPAVNSSLDRVVFVAVQKKWLR